MLLKCLIITLRCIIKINKYSTYLPQQTKDLKKSDITINMSDFYLIGIYNHVSKSEYRY